MIGTLDLNGLNLSYMLKNRQTYFKNFAVREHRKIFRVGLVMFQHYAWKG